MQYTLKKRNVKGKKIIVEQNQFQSVVFVQRRDCQKPVSGKGQNVFEEKKFYGMKFKKSKSFIKNSLESLSAAGSSVCRAQKNASFSDSAVAFHRNRVIFHTVI